MIEQVRPATHEQTFPGQGIIYDRAGIPVDATGWVWKLNHASSKQLLDFRRLQIVSYELLTSVALFLAERIQVVSADDVRNTFAALAYLRRSEHFQACAVNGAIIGERLISELRQVPRFAHWRLHYVRSWYRWCAQQRLPQFSPEVAATFDDLVFGTNERGRAVRTRDPFQGAFDDLEFVALTTALRASASSSALSLQERTLVWLAIGLGCNPLAYALLREEDYKPIIEHGTGRIHELYVPRIKKGSEEYRTEFHPEIVNDEIGALVAALIAHNRSEREARGWSEHHAHPLFVRFSPRTDLSLEQREYTMHFQSSEIGRLMVAVVGKLGLRSHRTGDDLRASPRRFRRTFATRAVEEGIFPVELATVLDHEDLQTVQVYYESRLSNQVQRLDAAIALKLAPLADAFMGRVVADESEAINGGNPSKRIPWHRRRAGQAPERNGNLGTCGTGACGLYAPISCYTCEKFQPWRNGPHREVLDWLCSERDRLEKDGRDPQIVKLNDSTILAVAEVVNLCEGPSA